jgi:lipid-binding SYLF domain-containing protein
MPVVTEAGLGFGGSYGTGVLRVNNQTVDYYSAAAASVGLQIGAQQYSHVLFFMTAQALEGFRASPGWTAGADIEYAVNAEGEVLRADTTTALAGDRRGLRPDGPAPRRHARRHEVHADHSLTTP